MTFHLQAVPSKILSRCACADCWGDQALLTVGDKDGDGKICLEGLQSESITLDTTAHTHIQMKELKTVIGKMLKKY